MLDLHLGTWCGNKFSPKRMNGSSGRRTEIK
jgi:hypothetical protein